MNKLLCVILVTLPMLACSPLEQKARDTSAALQGAIIAAQAKYHDSCVANSNQTVCREINNAIAAENGLITASETYCGWSPLAPPSDPNAKCVPVKTAQAALTVAIANAATLTLEIKGAI